MSDLGYAYLQRALRLATGEPDYPARLAAVTRVMRTVDALLVPAQVAPADTATPLEHILFALKHEGTNLRILAQALRCVPAAELNAAIDAAPTGGYIRIACYLWEHFTRQTLHNLPTIAGVTVNLFDPKKYLTGAAVRNARWRVNFNGLGSLAFCVTVERTAQIEALLAANILGRTQSFLSELGMIAAERAMSWAYLHETESSFAIEREKPTANKAEAFVAVLKQAHHPRNLDEAYLVALQNAMMTNPLDLAVSYRQQQNWLRGPLRGASGMTYLPPPPELLPDLMVGWLDFANTAAKQIDPLVAAAITSFGFVFLHPFMDGNGRLSRFLFHHTLCQSGQLAHGLLLPVSVAMKRNETAYLQALQHFSIPARRQWEVTWLGDEDYELKFLSDDTLYRYWDATSCVTFGLEMAQQALEHDLKTETDFLAQFDRLYQAIDQRFDLRGNDLTTLVLTCLQNNGKISANRRKQFKLTVPEKLFDAIEAEWAESHAPQ